MDLQQYGNAVLQGMVEARSPIAKMVMKQAEEESEDRDIERDERRAQFIERLEQKITTAEERSANPAVIAGYKRLIEKHSNKLGS